MAKTGTYITVPGLVAGTGLTTKQFYPVKIASTANQVLQATATTERVIGILMNNPDRNEPAEVAVLGVAKAIVGTSNLVRGEAISANNTGVLDVTAGYVCGYALESSSAKGDIVSVLLTGVRPY